MRTSMLMLAALGATAGCARQSVVVPPEALPAFAEKQDVVYARTSDGRRVVESGPIRWVGVYGAANPGDGPRAEWFRAPFSARVEGADLELADEEHRSRRSLRDVQQVEILYEARVGGRSTTMRIVGILLTSIASAALVSGIGVTAADIGGHGSGLATVITGIPLIATSTVFAGVGIPLWVVGETRIKAAVSAGPGSVRLTF